MNETIKILFLASNPIDTVRLRLDEETRRIDQALRMASYRDKFEFTTQSAVRISDLQELLLRHKPHIVHFSGYGSPEGEIILADDTQNSFAVPEEALSKLFAIFRTNIRCVILNSCYSKSQAQAIAEHIDCVIGMSKARNNEAAICFSSAFYRAIAYDQNLNAAFELARLQIELERLGNEDVPTLIGNIDKLANIYLLSDITQAAIKEQFSQVFALLNLGQYNQAARLCELVLKGQPEYAEANLITAICRLNGQSSDNHPRAEIRQVEMYLSTAIKYQSTTNAARIIMGLVKFDHYRNEFEGEPTLDEIKSSIDVNLTKFENYYLSHVNASSEAYSWLGIRKPNKRIGN